jgi:predicted ATP-dependent endonuclease of OLD family
MKIKNVRVKNFRCVTDSEDIPLGQVTCLVGKNESGKTSLLKALERFNPLKETLKGKFTRDLDWPRSAYAEFVDTAKVLETTWELEDLDVQAVEKELGKGSLRSRTFVVNMTYNGHSTWGLEINETKVREHLFQVVGLDGTERTLVSTVATIAEIPALLASKPEVKSPRTDNLSAKIGEFRDNKPILHAVDIVVELVPKVLYFDSYDRMSGKVSLTQLKHDKAHNTLKRGDEIFLNFLEYAGTNLDEISTVQNAESLFARFEGASNVISKKIFKYWRQNKHLSVKLSRNEALTGDASPFNSGLVCHTRIENRLHGVTVNFDERSAGFTWFFSFLVQFSLIKKKHGNVIILLDEPGLNLHGKAQADLLRFMLEELMPSHQVIYTTHSPFMVSPNHLDWVRTVEDVIVEDSSGGVSDVKGTKVGQNVLTTSADTLFPLQAALGYEITQSLFVGPNNLLLEGPGDVLYLTCASNALKQRKQKGLDSRWILVPCGGVDKVSAFLSLFAGNKLNVAVLSDYAVGMKAKVEALRKSEILEKGRVFTIAELINAPEGDIEDMWGDALFCELVNSTYSLPKKLQVTPTSLPKGTRVLKRVEEAFRSDAAYPDFSHFAPADWMLCNPDILTKESKETDAALTRYQAFFDKVNSLLK